MKPLNNERGAVLVAGLMILVILSLLGITTLQTSTIEEKMSNNMSQRILAFQAAEAALRQAEARVNEGGAVGEIAPGLLAKLKTAANTVDGDGDGVVEMWWDEDNTWADANCEIMTTSAIAGVPAPRYIVELLQEYGEDELDGDGLILPKPTMYRVSARGVGNITTAPVILQITHLR